MFHVARKCWNEVLQYSDAGKAHMKEQRAIRLALVEQLKQQRSLMRRIGILSRLVVSLFLWIFAGYMERPQRVLIAGGIVILLFAVFYLPELGIVALNRNGQTFTGGDGLTNSLITTLHFSVATYTTLGYGNIYPIDSAGMILTSVEAIVGFLMMGWFLFCLGRVAGPR
jgi:hypothetical protein